VTLRAGIGGLDEAPTANTALAHSYEYVGEVGKYLPAREAALVRKMRERAPKGGVASFLADLQATVLGGDFSPLGIQFMQKALFHPAATATQIARGEAAFAPASLAELVAKDPQGWRDFAFATGRSLTEGTPGEFGAGFLAKLPKVGGKIGEGNTRMYNFVMSAAKNDFVDEVRDQMAQGRSREDAIAIAGDFIQRMIPVMNPTRYGLSSAQFQARRVPLTSISFFRKSGELIADATRGYAKIAGGGGAIGPKALRMTPKESLAVRRVTKAAGLVGTISVASAVIEAQRTGQDVRQAAEDAVNPSSPRFLSLVIAGKRIPVGGPLRALFAAVYPRKVSGVPVPVPFGGMARYLENRIQPGISTAYHVAINRDFRGRPIYRRGEDSAVATAGKIAVYVAESLIPATPGEAAGDIRTGELGLDTAVRTAGQAFGQNVNPLRSIGDYRREWEPDTAAYQKLPANSREARAKRVLTRSEYRQRNPEVEARLFITGEVESLETMAARQIAVRLMRERRIRMEDVKAFKVEEYEPDTRRALRRWFERALGLPAMADSQNAAPARISSSATR